MTAKGLLSPRSFIAAIALVIAGLFVGWACVRAAVVRLVPSDSPALIQLLPHHPEVVLANATSGVPRKQRHLMTGHI
jgi:hypothetical protein